MVCDLAAQAKVHHSGSSSGVGIAHRTALLVDDAETLILLVETVLHQEDPPVVFAGSGLVLTGHMVVLVKTAAEGEAC